MKQYLITERAHFMCPNMYFGILLELEKGFQKESVLESFGRLADAHPFLKCRIAEEEETHRLFYDVREEAQIEVHFFEDDKSLWTDYQSLAKQEWNVFESGLLKVHIYPAGKGMKLLFIVNHLLADGRGALELAEEFANDYVGNKKPVYAQERLIQSIEDLPENSKLSGVSKLLVRQANRRWEKDRQRVSYEEYNDFVKKYNETHPTEYQTFQTEQEEVARMLQQCHENGYTMNDLLMAHMFIETKTDKIIMAADIRDKLSIYHKGALGNYATAMGIICKRRSTDVTELAQRVHKIIKKRMEDNRSLMLVLACYLEMNPALLDVAAISALGGFDSKAGRFVGETMFHMQSPRAYSITNLGSIQNQNISSVLFIPPASPATKLTMGVVTLNGVMRVCVSKNLLG